MAARNTFYCAPPKARWLFERMSKAALFDLAWDLAATAPDCASCDDQDEVMRVLLLQIANTSAVRGERCPEPREAAGCDCTVSASDGSCPCGGS